MARHDDSTTDDVHLDANVPGNPAYHFTIVLPGAPAKAGWTQRPALVPAAGPGTQCVHAGVQPDAASSAASARCSEPEQDSRREPARALFQ